MQPPKTSRTHTESWRCSTTLTGINHLAPRKNSKRFLKPTPCCLTLRRGKGTIRTVMSGLKRYSEGPRPILTKYSAIWALEDSETYLNRYSNGVAALGLEALTRLALAGRREGGAATCSMTWSFLCGMS